MPGAHGSRNIRFCGIIARAGDVPSFRVVSILRRARDHFKFTTASGELSSAVLAVW
jgi:hypothetical protein